MRWLRDEWNKPNRSDHYLMQLAALQVKGATADDLRIKFVSKEPEAPLTEEEILEKKRLKALESRAAWRARLGRNRQKPKERPPDRRQRRGNRS